MTSGKSTGGKGGTITLSVGDGDTGVGGDVNINAGKTSASNTQGGAVMLSSGASTQGTTSGTVDGGVSGEMTTGSTTSGSISMW